MQHKPAIACLIALTFFGAGCLGLTTPPSTEMCKKEARCSNDRSYLDECIADAKQARDDSKDAGCKGEYDNMNACIKRNTTCDDGYLAMDSMDACDDQVAEWFSCFGMGPF